MERNISQLLNAATQGAQHGMSCRCCGGSLFTLSTRTLELDMLDFLADKYQNEGQAELLQAVNDYPSPPGGIAAWLRTLDEQARLPAPLRDKLNDDIATLLTNTRIGAKY
jgi:hypothetical protein